MINVKNTGGKSLEERKSDAPKTKTKLFHEYVPRDILVWQGFSRSFSVSSSDIVQYLAYPLCRQFSSLERWGGFSEDLVTNKGGRWETLKVENWNRDRSLSKHSLVNCPRLCTTRQTRGVDVT